MTKKKLPFGDTKKVRVTLHMMEEITTDTILGDIFELSRQIRIGVPKKFVSDTTTESGVIRMRIEIEGSEGKAIVLFEENVKKEGPMATPKKTAKKAAKKSSKKVAKKEAKKTAKKKAAKKATKKAPASKKAAKKKAAKKKTKS